MVFLDSWREQLDGSLVAFGEFSRDLDDIDFQHGLLAASVLWPVKQPVQDANLDAINAVRQIAGPDAQTLLKAIQELPADRLLAMQYLAAQTSKDGSLRSALDRLVQYFNGDELLTRMLVQLVANKTGTSSINIERQIRGAIVNIGGLTSIKHLTINLGIADVLGLPKEGVRAEVETPKLNVFISSKMQELAPERKTLYDWIPSLYKDRVTLHPWVFEFNAPATSKSIREVYLNTLEQSSLYIGLFWKDYGEWTIDEFNRATEWGIERQLYVKNVDADKRTRKLDRFLKNQSPVEAGITPRWFATLDDLRKSVQQSIEAWLEDFLPGRRGAQRAILAVKGKPDELSREVPMKLIGRDAISSDIHRLLDQKLRIVLQGFGGTGKTAIAATVAVQWTEQDKGPVLWLPVGTDTAEILFAAIARRFEKQQQLTGDLDNQASAVREMIAKAGVKLVVLDNVWIARTLARMTNAVPADIPILITSRQRFLPDKGQIVRVDELGLEAALELLGYHNNQRDYRADPKARELCQRLGRLPFALEVASKTLNKDTISPAELLRRSDDALLKMTMPRGSLREQNIASLIQASLNPLNADIQAVFFAFGAFFAPSATPALLAGYTRKKKIVDSALSELQQRGLAEKIEEIEDTASFYRVHDLAYSFARRVFVQKRRSRQVVIRACLDYAQRQAGDLSALHAERNNILGAAEAAQQTDQADTLIAIMHVLAVGSPYFAAHGHTRTSLDLLRASIKESKDKKEFETAHYLLSRLGNAERDLLGDLNNAFRDYKEALELARTLKNTNREAILLSAIGVTRFRQRAADANDYLTEAYDLAKSMNDDDALGIILQNRSHVAIAQETPDYENALKFAKEAVQIAERLNRVNLLVDALVSQGACEHELKMLPQALSTHKRAYDLKREAKDPIGMARTLRSIGEDYHAMGSLTEARQAFGQALELFQEVRADAEVEDLVTFMQTKNYILKSGL